MVKGQAGVTKGNVSCKRYLIPSWSAQDVKNSVGRMISNIRFITKQDGKNMSNKSLINFIFLFQVLQIMDQSFSHKSTY